jgi:hypothetical protein
MVGAYKTSRFLLLAGADTWAKRTDGASVMEVASTPAVRKLILSAREAVPAALDAAPSCGFSDDVQVSPKARKLLWNLSPLIFNFTFWLMALILASMHGRRMGVFVQLYQLSFMLLLASCRVPQLDDSVCAAFRTVTLWCGGPLVTLQILEVKETSPGQAYAVAAAILTILDLTSLVLLALYVQSREIRPSDAPASAERDAAVCNVLFLVLLADDSARAPQTAELLASALRTMRGERERAKSAKLGASLVRAVPKLLAAGAWARLEGVLCSLSAVLEDARSDDVTADKSLTLCAVDAVAASLWSLSPRGVPPRNGGAAAACHGMVCLAALGRAGAATAEARSRATARGALALVEAFLAQGCGDGELHHAAMAAALEAHSQLADAALPIAVPLRQTLLVAESTKEERGGGGGGGVEPTAPPMPVDLTPVKRDARAAASVCSSVGSEEFEGAEVDPEHAVALSVSRDKGEVAAY